MRHEHGREAGRRKLHPRSGAAQEIRDWAVRSRPAGASNYLMPSWLKTVVMSDEGKASDGGSGRRPQRTLKTLDAIKTGVSSWPREDAGGSSLTDQAMSVLRWREPGLRLVWNVRRRS